MTAYDIWLDQIPEIGGTTILALRRYMGGDRNFAEEFYRMTRQQREESAFGAIAQTQVRSEKVIRRKACLLAEGPGKDPEQCVQDLEQKGIHCAVYDDPEYPERLRNLPDPPFGLYYYGRLPSNTYPSAAIIGTRMASAYGRDQARIFARELARSGIQIISGMALGIDGIAGRGALDVDGASYAVLGCGVDICYPKENADLYGALKERGGVLSEYPPGSEPQRKMFPSRNRIISGLSDVVLVIEAREKSGTLITVDRALEYGIDVFALPGRVTDRNSRGCNELIRQGAGIATRPQDIEDYLFGIREPVQMSLDLAGAGKPGQMEYGIVGAGGLDSAGAGKPAQMKCGPVGVGGQGRAGEEGPAKMECEPGGAGGLEHGSAGRTCREEVMQKCLETGEAGERMQKDPGVGGAGDLMQKAPGAVGTGNVVREAPHADGAGNAVRKDPHAGGGENSVRKVSHAGGEEDPARMSKLEWAVYDAMDPSTPRGVDALLPAVRSAMKRTVSYQEVLRTMTLLVLKDLAAEVRVGNYISRPMA